MSQREKQELLEEMTRSREHLKRVLARIPKDRLEETGAVGHWTPRDVIGHVAVWERDRIQFIGDHLERGIPLAPWRADTDEHNERLAEEERGRSMARLWEEFEAAHVAWRKYVTSVPENHFAAETPLWDRIEGIAVRHSRNHARDLEEWLDRGAPLSR